MVHNYFIKIGCVLILASCCVLLYNYLHLTAWSVKLWKALNFKLLKKSTFNISHKYGSERGSERCPKALLNVSSDNMEVYKDQFNYTLTPKQRCKCNNFSNNSIGVIIAIISSIPSVEQRNVYRKIMQQASTSNTLVRFLYLFFVGLPLPGTLNSSQQTAITAESDLYNDIVQDGFIDDYYNMTLKTLGIFRWVTIYCNPVDFLYLWRITDDVYFDPDVFAAHVQFNPVLNQSDLYWGHTVIDHPVMKNNKWSVRPLQEWPSPYYPDHQAGAAVLFTVKTATKLYHMSKMTPIFFPDDIYMSILVHKLGLPVTPGNAFVNDHLQREQIFKQKYRRTLTDHLYQTAKMTQAWDVSNKLYIDYEFIKCATSHPYICDNSFSFLTSFICMAVLAACIFFGCIFWRRLQSKGVPCIQTMTLHNDSTITHKRNKRDI